MKVIFFVKSLWSLVLASEDFLLAGISQFSTQKTSVNEDISFDQAKFTSSSFGLAWHGFCACPRCYGIPWNFQWTLYGVCIHCTLILCYICKNLSKKWDLHEVECLVISTLWKIKTRIFPSSKFNLLWNMKSIWFVYQSYFFLFLTDRVWEHPRGCIVSWKE